VWEDDRDVLVRRFGLSDGERREHHAEPAHCRGAKLFGDVEDVGVVGQVDGFGEVEVLVGRCSPVSLRCEREAGFSLSGPNELRKRLTYPEWFRLVYRIPPPYQQPNHDAPEQQLERHSSSRQPERDPPPFLLRSVASASRRLLEDVRLLHASSSCTEALPRSNVD